MSSQDLLNVDAAAVETAGRDFLVARDEAESAMNRMRSQVSNLQATFRGAAADSFYAKMEEIFRMLMPMVEEVGEMGNDLITTAAKIRQLQAEMSQLLRD